MTALLILGISMLLFIGLVLYLVYRETAYDLPPDHGHINNQRCTTAERNIGPHGLAPRE
jgi:hypothetical protein